MTSPDTRDTATLLGKLRESITMGGGATPMSRQQLAEALGVDRSTVHRWESGETPIPPAVLLALLWIRHNRRFRMRGRHYPLVADVQALMADEDVDQETAIRSFGVQP